MCAVALRWCRALILCSLLVVSACSSTTFVYNRLDFILPWYLDDYAELNGEQEEHLDTLLSPFLSWHRSQELPRYIAVLEHIETTLDRPLTPEDVASISAEFERAWFRLEGEALDWLLELGASLTDEQMDSFMAALWEQQHEYEEKYLERSEEDAAERIVFGDERPPTPRDLQLGLFAPAPPSPAIEALRELDLDALTPLEALNRLAEIKRLAER